MLVIYLHIFISFIYNIIHYNIKNSLHIKFFRGKLINTIKNFIISSPIKFYP